MLVSGGRGVELEVEIRGRLELEVGIRGWN